MGPDTLKTAQHPMSRPKTGLDAEKLLTKGARGIGGDPLTFCPSFFTASLDSLVGGTKVAWKKSARTKQNGQNKKRRSRLG